MKYLENKTFEKKNNTEVSNLFNERIRRFISIAAENEISRQLVCNILENHKFHP